MCDTLLKIGVVSQEGAHVLDADTWVGVISIQFQCSDPG